MGSVFGRLERVDLREAWVNEANDFTPWLAGPENLSLLGDAIGIELELESQEAGVGPFRADILCKDTVNGHYVLVENQLERTDHVHLGQLITYAAGLQAVTIVWIAQRFTDEHRAALDWLNGITDEDVNFFGLEVELWRIGDSAIAPKFNLVSKPNEWTRQVAVAKRRELTEVQDLQVEYWGRLNDLLVERGVGLSPRKPLPQSWASFSIGRSGARLDAACSSFDNVITVSLTLDDRHAKAYFAILEADKGRIEQEIGSQLEWHLKPETKVSYIRLTLRDEDYRDRNRWPTQHAWLATWLDRFERVLRERVRDLDSDAAPRTEALIENTADAVLGDAVEDRPIR